MRDHVEPSTRARAVAAARGTGPFDTILVGGTVADVGTGQLIPADVGLVGELIASVHPTGTRFDGAQIVDCAGKFIAPGFIDMHVHFESSMLTPGPFAAAVCPRGTTTLFCDPHELANVVGVDGVRYAIDASRGLPTRFLFQAPSCVPPVPGLELSGSDLTADDVALMLEWPEVVGVAEVMDMLGVLGGDERMVGVVGAGLDADKIVSGHAAGLSIRDLQAYLVAGIDSDHELFGEGDALNRLSAGMTVEMRGVVEDLLPDIVAAIEQLPELPTHVVACTDDLFASTLLDEGGIDHLLRRMVELGMSPIRAIRIATYHAAYRLGRNDLGMVGAGRRADLAILSSLEEITVDDVWFGGRHVASGGQMIVDTIEGDCDAPLDTVHLAPVTPADFTLRVDAASGSTRLRTIDGVIMTTWGETVADVSDGQVGLPDGVMLQAVFHRHGRSDSTPGIGLISGWGPSWTGAIATTVSHDTHNLVVFGRDPVAMATAANALIAAGGGVAVARGDQVTAMIALPVAGILSSRPCDEIADAQRSLLAEAQAIGLPGGVLTQPLMQVMASSLACLPGPHVTDFGLIDGDTGQRINSVLVDVATA